MGLGFQVEIEPSGKAGPDSRITRDGYRAVVEITRFRLMNSSLQRLDISSESVALPEYGNPKRDIRKAMRKIYRKFSQIGHKKAIIALWNDDEDLGEVEVRTAVDRLKEDESLPNGLIFVLYGSKWIAPSWVGPTGHQQLYCFPLDKNLEFPYKQWMREFESFRVGELIQRSLE
jgi:hypothetical protein